jgi:hypothetical protein
MPAKNMCKTCGTPHEPLIDCVSSVRTVVLQLLGRIGRLDRCSACGVTIYWLLTLGSGAQSFDAAGFYHGACEATRPRAGRVPIEEQLFAVRRIMLAVATVGNCSRCMAPIYWIRHPNGVNTPYTEAALNHFIDCPRANEFRRKKR